MAAAAVKQLFMFEQVKEKWCWITVQYMENERGRFLELNCCITRWIYQMFCLEFLKRMNVKDS